jgi:hypothetical protein
MFRGTLYRWHLKVIRRWYERRDGEAASTVGTVVLVESTRIEIAAAGRGGGYAHERFSPEDWGHYPIKKIAAAVCNDPTKRASTVRELSP